MTGGFGLLEGVQGLLREVEALRWWLAAGLMVVVCMGAAVAVWWRRRAVEELAHRVTFDVIPSAVFDPSQEEIGRRAAQLERARGAAGWIPRRAAAVRLRMAAEGGALLTQVQGHVRMAGLLQRTPFSDVEVVESGSRGRGAAPRVRLEGASSVRAVRRRS